MRDFLKAVEIWYEGNGFTVKIVGIILIILIAIAADRLICAIVDRTFRGDVNQGENNRRITLQRVVRNLTHYLLAFIAAVMVLSTLGVNVMSIMAAAGVIGLAVSFGAQSLIKDIFAGFFIIFENQYGVGEYITVNNNFTGFVELVGLRTTQLRGDNGELIIMPNGTINEVVNYCRGSLRIKEVFEISFDSSIDGAEEVIRKAAKAYYEGHKDLLVGEPTVGGVDVIGASGISLCLFAYVQPMEKWRVERELRKVIVQALQNAGITIPYPVTEVISKEM